MKYLAIIVVSLILLFGGVVLFSSSPREAATQPIRDEFAQRQLKGIKDQFKIGDVTFSETEAQARVAITHESGVTEDFIFYLKKESSGWVITKSERFVEVKPSSEDEVIAPKLISVEYYGSKREQKPLDENGYPVYTFSIFDQSTRYLFDRPLIKPVKIKFQRKHLGVYGGSSMTFTLNPTNPPSNIIWKDASLADSFEEKRAGNLGIYEDVYTLDGEATVAHFVVQ